MMKIQTQRETQMKQSRRESSFVGMLAALALWAVVLMPPTARARSGADTMAVKRMAQAARQAGMPPDQLNNFLAGGYVPQPKQMAFHAACRQCDHRDGPTRVGFGGARGPGKSHACLAQVALDDCQRFPGLKVLYLRKIGKSGREAIQDQRRSVLHSTQHEYKAQEGIILFPNGSRIIIGHFKDEKQVDAYLGLEYDLIIVEEATTLSSSKVKNILTCLRTSKPDWRPRAYFTTNPGNIGHAWFKKMFMQPWRAGNETTTRFIPATVYDNKFVNREYRTSLEELTGWQRKAWLLGDWDIAAGQYFTNWRHNIHVRAMPELSPEWSYFGGFDYGFTHYTAFHPIAKDGDGTLWIFDEYAARRRLVESNADGVKATLERHGITLGQIRIHAGTDVFSRTHTGATIAGEYKREGLVFTPANTDRINGAAEILRRLGDPDNGIAPTLFVSERCARLIECIPALQHDPHRPEDVLKTDCDDDGAGGDDAFDSSRYAVMSTYRRRATAI